MVVMNLHNIDRGYLDFNLKNGLGQRGFTIVELLIVIVVIGILAAITVVAYSNISTQANLSTSRSNAIAVRDVAMAYHAENGGMPTLAQLLTGGTYGKLPSTLSVGENGTMPASNTNIYYIAKSTTGACIGYKPVNTGSMLWYYIGNATGSTPTVGTGSTGTWPTITGGSAAVCP